MPIFRRRFLMSLLLSVAVVLSVGPAALGQFSFSGGTDVSPYRPPSGVDRLGDIETAPVDSPFLVQELFRVAAPTVYNRDGSYSSGNIPVEIRADAIEANLQRAADLLTDLDSMEVRQATLNGSTILQVTDVSLDRPINLLTVTELDASLRSQPVEEVATEWEGILQEDFRKILQNKAGVGEQVVAVAKILAGLITISLVLQLLHWWLRRRYKALKRQQQQQDATLCHTEDALKPSGPDPVTADAQSIAHSALSKPASTTKSEAAPSDSPANAINQSAQTMGDTPAPVLPEDNAERIEERFVQARSRLVGLIQQQLSLRRQRRLNKLLRWCIFWVQVTLLFIGAIWITGSVTAWRRATLWLWGLPIQLLLVAFGTSLAIRLSHWLIHRVEERSESYPLTVLGESERRRRLRVATIADVLKGVTTLLFIAVGVVTTLDFIGLPTESILAGGAVIAFAISFGSQNLIKDFITGCFILLEDQYAVGDVVSIGDASGLVETLNLRVTQLRDGEGRLITIPNSSITHVKNLTRLWSRVDFTVTVAYETNPKTAMALLNQIGTDLYREPDWQDKMLEPPMVMGIDHMSHEGMMIRVWIKTRPLQQWATGREFRYRVRQAFEQHGIQIGKPQWVVAQSGAAAIQPRRYGDGVMGDRSVD